MRHQLVDLPNGSISARRITVQRPIVIPAQSQVDVPTRLVYRCPSVASEGPWANRVGEVRPGVMLARTLIADRSGDLRVRLLNLNEHLERLPVGLDLGELERVLALEPSLEERGTASEPNHVQPLLETVDPSVPVEQRQELANLLHRFSDVFSKGDDDLGCTSFVQCQAWLVNVPTIGYRSRHAWPADMGWAGSKR